jgi:hypothetical protein
MTIDEKLKHIEGALSKVRAMAEGYATDTFSYAECDAIEAALEIAAGVCTLLKDRSR